MKVRILFSKQKNIDYFNSDDVELDMEEYLVGVVATEIGNAPVAACEAQAVAARTYAMSKIKSKGYITDNSSVDQAFRAERLQGYPNAREGVNNTAGRYLTYNGKLISAVYSENNGGTTVSAKERWGNEVAYLISRPDLYDAPPKRGHGVGLSQVGAKARAAAGQGYEDILAFYYPGCKMEVEKEMTEKEQTIYDWVNSHVSDGYCWGATGKTLTQAYLDQLIKQYPDHVSQAQNGKWLGKTVWDCASLVRGAMKTVGISMVSGATSQVKKTKWQVFGTIDNLPKDKICCLYRWNGSSYQHTGIYCGDSYVVDARGSKSGVIKSTLTSYPWTHFGIPEGLYDEQKPSEVYKVLYQAKVYAESGSTVRMRATASSSARVIKEIPVGEIVDVIEEGENWDKIGYEGSVGYMMSKFLKKEGAAEEGVYYVRIRCGSESEAKKLVELLNKATVG